MGRVDNASIAVGIVDNDVWALQALKNYLQAAPKVSVAWTASTVSQAKCLLQNRKVSLLLVDMSLGDVDGVELTRQIRERDSRMPVIGLTSFPTEDYAAAFARAGGQALVSKGEPQTILSSIHVVADSGTGEPVSGTAFEQPEQAFSRLATSKATGIETLTQRERQLISLCAQGMTSANIAKHLGLATATVNNEFQRICGKMGVANRMQLMAAYITAVRPRH